MSAPALGAPPGAVGVRMPFARALTILPEWAQQPAPVRPGPWNGTDRRSRERLRRLAREHDQLCTAAVDAAEVAAGLEAAGFTDGTAQEHGFPGVFDLAEALFEQTPRLADRGPGSLPNPWSESPLRHLARGLTFAVPGLILVAFLPAAGSGVGRAFLVAGMLLGWPTAQLIAFVGHSLDGRGQRRAAAAALLLALAVAAPGAGALGLLAAVSGAPAGVPLVVAGQMVYVAAASALLVLGGELLVLGALLPGVVAVGYARWVPGAPEWLSVLGAAVSLGLAVGAALLVCAWARPAALRAGLRHLGRHDRVDALFHLGYALAGGVLVTLPTLGGTGSVAGGLALLPVIWSLGGAEWSVVRLRRRSFDLLTETASVRGFARAVRRLMLATTSGYLLQLTVISGLVAVGLRLADGAWPQSPTLLALAAGWLLGCGFYLALALTSLVGIRAVVPGLLVAVGVGALAQVAAPAALAVLVGPVVLVAALLPGLPGVATDPARHM